MSSKMTKAQLVDENIRLREALNNLEIRHAFVVEENEELRKGERIVRYQPVAEQPVVTYTKRDGTRWGKFRVGHNTFAHRAMH